jgi:acyl-ACP thioesterase
MLTELVARPDCGRTFARSYRPGMGDCAPGGRMRLDGLARWLQDVAYEDVEDAGLHTSAVWVVRRTRISVRRFPRFAERCTALTFCSGIGRMWAERRTTIFRDAEDDADVEAVSLWVHLDALQWRPTPFSTEELAVYGAGLPERKITAKLRHPPPGGAEELGRWRFRAGECDVAGHVNNAAYLLVLEEELLGRGREPAGLEVEIEYRTPAQPGEKRVLGHGARRWLAGPGGEVHASTLMLEPGSGAGSRRGAPAAA